MRDHVASRPCKVNQPGVRNRLADIWLFIFWWMLARFKHDIAIVQVTMANRNRALEAISDMFKEFLRLVNVKKMPAFCFVGLPLI